MLSIVSWYEKMIEDAKTEQDRNNYTELKRNYERTNATKANNNVARIKAILGGEDDTMQQARSS